MGEKGPKKRSYTPPNPFKYQGGENGKKPLGKFQEKRFNGRGILKGGGARNSLEMQNWGVSQPNFERGGKKKTFPLHIKGKKKKLSLGRL